MRLNAFPMSPANTHPDSDWVSVTKPMMYDLTLSSAVMEADPFPASPVPSASGGVSR